MTNNNNLPANRPEDKINHPEIPATLFKEFLDNQTKELELKNRQIDLEKQKDDHAFEWARTSLDAQVVDREKQRSFHLTSRKNVYVFATIIAILFVGLLIAALLMNKDAVALEIIKAVIFIFTGGAGGYAVGRQKSTGASSSDSPKDH
jgi:hypothetical protein